MIVDTLERKKRKEEEKKMILLSHGKVRLLRVSRWVMVLFTAIMVSKHKKLSLAFSALLWTRVKFFCL